MVGVGETQSKICDQGETVLPHSNVQEWNLLLCVYGCLHAACSLSRSCMNPGVFLFSQE